jgi:2-methylcitrate dehydratase PrpD
MDSISLKESPELTRLYPQKWPSRVEIALKNGETYQGYCEYAKGEPENPLSETELIQKFNKLCGDIITKDERDRIAEVVLDLEKVEDVATIFHG